MGGKQIETPVQYIDLLPTLMGITGIDDHGGKPLDGLDMSGIIMGVNADVAPERDLYSFIAQLDPEREQVSVTEGEWKLVVIGPPLPRPGAAERSRKILFHIASDPLENDDVADEHPEIVARLLAKAADFRALQPTNHIVPFREGQEGFKPPPNWDFAEE